MYFFSTILDGNSYNFFSVTYNLSVCSNFCELNQCLKGGNILTGRSKNRWICRFVISLKGSWFQLSKSDFELRKWEILECLSLCSGLYFMTENCKRLCIEFLYLFFNLFLLATIQFKQTYPFQLFVKNLVKLIHMNT